MSCKLRYAPEAIDDLDQVWMEVWTASKDFDTADRYIEDLRAKIRKKTDFPESGSPLVYMGEFTGLYMIYFKSYIAFYRIRKDAIEVGRVLFAASDYMKTLFGEAGEEQELSDTERIRYELNARSYLRQMPETELSSRKGTK